VINFNYSSDTYQVYYIERFFNDDLSMVLGNYAYPDEIKNAYAMWSAPYKKSIKTQVNNLEQIINS
jgi:hypothetical protein